MSLLSKKACSLTRTKRSNNLELKDRLDRSEVLQLSSVQSRLLKQWTYHRSLETGRETGAGQRPVLKLDIHRFNTFLYISTIMFHHFSLKLPIFALIFTYFWKIWENIKFKYCNPQKAHLCVRPRVLNSRCLIYFYICDLYTRRKNRLSDCACKKKKTETSPICLAKMG